MYFGKTVRKNPFKYLGSGHYWAKHLAVHGSEHVETIYCELFPTEELCLEFAEFFSEFHNVEHSELWANLQPEDGLNVGTVYWRASKEQRRKNSISKIGRVRTPKHKENLSKARKGQPANNKINELTDIDKYIDIYLSAPFGKTELAQIAKSSPVSGPTLRRLICERVGLTGRFSKTKVRELYGK